MLPKFIIYKRLKEWVKRTQSWLRRTLVRNQYLRVLHATKTVQMYVRRYLCQLFVWRIWKGIWGKKETEMAAIIRIQCRFRIFNSKKRIRLMQRQFNKYENAALAIQRNWYQSRNEYSSFFLVSAYRARKHLDEIEKKNAKKNSIGGKAEIIQRKFRDFLRKRFCFAAIFIQKHFRRLLGTRFAFLLRRKKVAGRKIRIWLKFCMKRRHFHARTIQRIWWSLMKGRLIRHLYGNNPFSVFTVFCHYFYRLADYRKRYIYWKI